MESFINLKKEVSKKDDWIPFPLIRPCPVFLSEGSFAETLMGAGSVL